MKIVLIITIALALVYFLPIASKPHGAAIDIVFTDEDVSSYVTDIKPGDNGYSHNDSLLAPLICTVAIIQSRLASE
jgi:hypothetical protein